MNFQIISDIHGRYKRIEFNKNADIILFAGDTSENFDLTCSMLKSAPAPVCFIPGNHEFYHKDYYDTYNRLRDFCYKSKDHIIFLDNQTIEIDNFRILGTTLWSDFDNFDPFSVESSWGVLNDYRKIKINQQNDDIYNDIEKLHDYHLSNIESILNGEDQYKKDIIMGLINKRKNMFKEDPAILDQKMFSPHMSYVLNKKNKKWLNNELSHDFNGNTIVMTHHSPSYTPLILGKYAVSPFEKFISDHVKRKVSLHKIGGYCNSMENMVLKYNVDTWIHGHFHEFLNYRLGNSNVICNALGNDKNQEMGYRDFIFQSSENEKKSALKYQLSLFISACNDLLYFFEVQINEKINISDLVSLKILSSYWIEIEIMLNNIHTLPLMEIHETFHNYYPDPFAEFLETNKHILNYSEVIFLLNKMQQETETIYFNLKKWHDNL